jgi:hypothetical protein
VKAPNYPKHWRYETSGVLRPVIDAYLRGHELTTHQVSSMRAYLRQWIQSPAWFGDNSDLKRSVEAIQTVADIQAWVKAAVRRGMDPL